MNYFMIVAYSSSYFAKYLNCAKCYRQTALTTIFGTALVSIFSCVKLSP